MVYHNLLQPVEELHIERLVQAELCPVIVNGLRCYIRVLIVGREEVTWGKAHKEEKEEYGYEQHRNHS